MVLFYILSMQRQLCSECYTSVIILSIDSFRACALFVLVLPRSFFGYVIFGMEWSVLIRAVIVKAILKRLTRFAMFERINS